MLVKSVVIAGVLLASLGLSGPAAAQHEIASSDWRDNPVYRECRAENVNDNQCYCFGQWIYQNGWEVNKGAVIKIMQAYPITEGEAIGEEVWQRTGLTLSEDDMIRAVDLIVAATGYCKNWEAK